METLTIFAILTPVLLTDIEFYKLKISLFSGEPVMLRLIKRYGQVIIVWSNTHVDMGGGMSLQILKNWFRSDDPLPCFNFRCSIYQTTAYLVTAFTSNSRAMQGKNWEALYERPLYTYWKALVIISLSKRSIFSASVGRGPVLTRAAINSVLEKISHLSTNCISWWGVYQQCKGFPGGHPSWQRSDPIILALDDQMRTSVTVMIMS